MQVICLEEPAFYSLVEEVVARLKGSERTEQPKWINGTQVMEMLSIKSKTTLQKLRDEGHVRFSQPEKRIILYDRISVLEYLELNARETF